MTIEFAQVSPQIRIAYERLGDPGDPPVLLIMGANAQLIAWPDGFCDALVARGLQLVRFDNRDVGLSTHLHDAPKPDVREALAGDLSSASYTLSDMARDTIGLMDALELASAHVVGASLGGFIAQTAAIEHPSRVRTLTSIMATTGDRSVGQAHPDMMKMFATSKPATTRDEVIQQPVDAFAIIGSPAYPPEPGAVAARAARGYDRAFDPLGGARQALAAVASGDRCERQANFGMSGSCSASAIHARTRATEFAQRF